MLAFGKPTDLNDECSLDSDYKEREIGLTSNFIKKNHSTHTNMKEESDVNMLCYIEQGLAEKRKYKVKSQDCSMDEQGCKTAADLFTVPSHLKGIERFELSSEACGWLSGIQEIKLPQEYSMKNIEDTEIAKGILVKETIVNEMNKSILRPELISNKNFLISKNNYILQKSN